MTRHKAHGANRRLLPRPLRDRRGGTTVALAVGATALLGMAALATEGGVWYMSRRNAQSAADAAAYAGVVQLAFHQNMANGKAAAVTVGEQVAATNSFADEGRAAVTVTPCAWNGGPNCTPGVTVPNAVQVDISQVQLMGLARLISNTAPTAQVSAIAAILDNGPACTLSLTGATTFTGNNTTAAPECTLASNRAGPTSFQFKGSATLTAHGIRAVGSCDGCEGATLNTPFIADAQVPIEDPYAHLRTPDAFPAYHNNNDCQEGKKNGKSAFLEEGVNWTDPRTGETVLAANVYRPRPYDASGLFICGQDIKINNSTDVLELEPGTYFFYGTSLDVTDGRVLCPSCAADGPGVTLVFTGSGNGNNSIGTVRITGGRVNLNAPAQGPWYSVPGYMDDDGVTPRPDLYQGILFYRDYRATPNNSTQLDNMNAPNTATFVGNSTVCLAGGFYFPSSQVEFAGNTASGTCGTSCASIIAATIQITGNSTLTVNGCGATGTSTARDRIVRLVR